MFIVLKVGRAVQVPVICGASLEDFAGHQEDLKVPGGNPSERSKHPSKAAFG